MNACKLICLDTNGQNFVNAVAYLYGQVIKIFPNENIEDKNKHRLSEVSNGQGRGRGCVHGRCQNDRCDGGGGSGRGDHGGGRHVGSLDLPYNTWCHTP